MEETTQKNIVLIGTCFIVICFHLAYKMRSNLKFCNILLVAGFFTSLLLTKLLHDWEKENKVDYNLLLFLYYLVDLLIVAFFLYRYFDIKKILRGGGNGELNIVEEFKSQDKIIKGFAESELSTIFTDKIKNRLTDYIVGVLGRIRI